MVVAFKKVENPTGRQKTMSDVIRTAVDDFLAQQKTAKHHARGRLIMALDATASREETWDHAVKLQADMFREVASIGKLDVQLMYFRGIQGVDGECRASSWVGDAMQLARLMNHVTCRAGHTQIARVLRYTLQETTAGSPVSALVYVGDMCEDSPDELLQAARALGQHKVPVFMSQEGRDPGARRLFQQVAKLTNGVYATFNAGSAAQLAELLRAVALFATGGLEALAHSSNKEAVRLLGALRG
jgi:hypothetical protein